MHHSKKSSGLWAIISVIILAALMTQRIVPPPEVHAAEPKDILLLASISESSDLPYQFDSSSGILRSQFGTKIVTDPLFLEFRTIPPPQGDTPPLWELARTEEERLAGKVSRVLELACGPERQFVCYVRFRIVPEEAGAPSRAGISSDDCQEMPPRGMSKYPPFKVEGVSVLLVFDAQDFPGENLKKLEDLVTRAVGIDTVRGDRVTVLALRPFYTWHEIYEWSLRNS